MKIIRILTTDEITIAAQAIIDARKSSGEFPEILGVCDASGIDYSEGFSTPFRAVLPDGTLLVYTWDLEEAEEWAERQEARMGYH